MKRILFLGMIVSLLSILSCNKQSEESQLYIVDSIKLGSTKRDFVLNKPSGITLVTKTFLSYTELSEHLVHRYYTLTFNLNDSTDSGGWSDYGLIIPDYGTASNNLLGVKILFGRTTGAIILGTSYNPPFPAFVQANREIYIQRIKHMLIKKYGNPTKIITEKYIPFYVFQGKKIEAYGTDEDNKGELLEWENDIVKITLFTGIDNYDFTYNQALDGYFMMLQESSKSKEISEGTEITKGFAYLKYELKKDYIEKKKLDVPNL